MQNNDFFTHLFLPIVVLSARGSVYGMSMVDEHSPEVWHAPSLLNGGGTGEGGPARWADELDDRTRVLSGVLRHVAAAIRASAQLFRKGQLHPQNLKVTFCGARHSCTAGTPRSSNTLVIEGLGLGS